MVQEWAHLGLPGLALALGGVLAFNFVFHFLYRAGIALKERGLQNTERLERLRDVA
jgi:hypothetical protein